ncbi:MAG: hypothetical protein ABI432_04155 [Flavobacteriales bacterium]
MCKLDFDPWATIEALSAVVMAVFTWKLFRVSDQQRAIAANQQALMAQANQHTIDVQSGVLDIASCKTGGAWVFCSFKNIGGTRLRLEEVKIKLFDGRIPIHPEIWEGVQSVAPYKVLESGEVYNHALLLPKECFTEEHKVLENFQVILRARYKTMGTEQEMIRIYGMTKTSEDSEDVRSSYRIEHESFMKGGPFDKAPD